MPSAATWLPMAAQPPVAVPMKSTARLDQSTGSWNVWGRVLAVLPACKLPQIQAYLPAAGLEGGRWAGATLLRA